MTSRLLFSVKVWVVFVTSVVSACLGTHVWALTGEHFMQFVQLS